MAPHVTCLLLCSLPWLPLPGRPPLFLQHCRTLTAPTPAEKYLREVWPAVTKALKEHGIACELNLVEGSMTVGRGGGLLGSRSAPHFWGTEPLPLTAHASWAEGQLS